MKCQTCGNESKTVIEHTQWCPRCGTLHSTSCPPEVPTALGSAPVGEAFTGLEVMVACSLYWFNVRRDIVAQKLYDYFKGHCMEVEEMVQLLRTRGGDIATALPCPTTELYVAHALERYGAEAKEHVRVNLEAYRQTIG